MVSSVVVDTEDGQIRGWQLTSTRASKQYTVFYGLPYAAPPVGELRLLPPQPVRPWPGVWDSRHTMRRACVQSLEAGGGGGLQVTLVHRLGLDHWLWFELQEESEDCLYLNVATPALLLGALNCTQYLELNLQLLSSGC